MPYYYKETKKFIKQVMKRVEEAIYTPVLPLDVKAWVTHEPVPFDKRYSGRELVLKVGDHWGNLWDCAWFHFTAIVPEAAAGEKVVLLIDVNGEACIVDEGGSPVQGLTNVNSEFDCTLGKPGKRIVELVETACGGEKVDLWADAGCNDLFGKYQGHGTLKEACIAICNTEMRSLYYDFEVLEELMECLPEDSARHHSIFFALNQAAQELKDYTREEAKKARDILAVELEKKGGHPSLTMSAIGHAHIDLGWLWPIRETVRKGARTFSTVLRMMERYPDYVFGASQPQLYQWMKDHYPALYSQIKERIQEGRWEPQGAMWVEADTNISGGEALVRQVLYGKAFFRQEFGRDMKILWLPDVFGYSAALPQILKKSGVDYFLTIKLSWNEYNQHPHHTFLWEGMDGSTVLAHMPPEGTYNSSAAPRAVLGAERQYLDKGVSDRCMMLFGIGDGGGGPGEEHLERLQREKNLAGLAPVVQEPALEFFKKLEKNQNRYKTWVGELYLEKHQGTFTSQARNKWFNRKLELALRDLEYLCVLAGLVPGVEYEYPQQELEAIWKELLLYQFHDILPGSSITRVYDESLERYNKLLNRTNDLSEETGKILVDKVDTSGMSRPVMIINSLSWERKEWLCIEGNWIHAQVPAMGYTVVDVDSNTYVQEVLDSMLYTQQRGQLENDKLVVKFDKDGTIVSIYDKDHQREVLEKGKRANRLSVYEDTGDAWDFPVNYDEKSSNAFVLQQTETYVDGPRTILKHTYTYGKSTLTQEVVLTAGSRRIDFVTEVDWQESNRMLRTSFPVNVYAREAVCDIQFGSIKRPTHRNTSWDKAKYEVPVHKWMDLSQGDYGVALLNDCKYGYKVRDNILDLNLLRSPGHPDPKADRGYHQFTYSLYPHQGDHIEGNVARKGYELNIPLGTVKAKNLKGSNPKEKSYVTVTPDNIIIESIKKAENDSDVVIRLFEACGAGSKASIQLHFGVESVQLVNLMEEDGMALPVENGSFQLEFGPFDIHTLKIKPR